MRGDLSPSLTPTEYRVLARAAHGRSCGEIGSDLGISYHTVKHHLSAVNEKLDTTCQVEAFRKMGWLQPPDEPEVTRYSHGGRLIAEVRRLARLIRQTERNP